MNVNVVWLALAWIAYALLHSVLASFAVKNAVARRWPAAAPYYRLAFNGIALAAVLPIVWLTYALDGPTLWQWTGPWRWLSHALAIGAAAGFVVVARGYDMDAFLGLRQIRERNRLPDGHEGFHLSPFHRYVRHPWYFFGLVLVWTGDKTPALLVSTVAITLYFAIGSWFEERKLLALHGEAYRRYMARVPGLFPLPWKRLTRQEAADLVQRPGHG
jgi:protein-S-isoprenylcysteine O-methyltransferase Ste14